MSKSRKKAKALIRELRKANAKLRRRARRQSISKARHQRKPNGRIKVQRRKRRGPYPRYYNHKLRLTYLISRRCLGRVFRLSPSDPTRKLFEYFLAYAARRYKVAINAVVVMSNHYHLVVSATRWNSNISGFMRCLNHNTSKVLNRRQGKRGPLYEVEPFDIRPLATKEDILRAMTYVVYNPVKAGLTEEPADWPGLVTTFEDYDKPHEIVERPEFFGKSSKKPKEIQLIIERPFQFRRLTDKEWNNLLKESGDRYRDDIHQQRAEAGLSFLGVEAIRNQSIDDSPNSPDVDREQLATEENATSHGFFISDSEEEQAYKASQDNFRERHQECIEQVKAGKRPIFPYPTLKMVHTYGFPVEPIKSQAPTPVLHHCPELALE